MDNILKVLDTWLNAHETETLNLPLASRDDRLIVHEWADRQVPPLFDLAWHDKTLEPSSDIGSMKKMYCEECFQWRTLKVDAWWHNPCCGDNPDGRCDSGAWYCGLCLRPRDCDGRRIDVSGGNNVICISRKFDGIAELLASRPHMMPKRLRKTPRVWYDAHKAKHSGRYAARIAAKTAFDDALWRRYHCDSDD